jgi:hypothetical protein
VRCVARVKPNFHAKLQRKPLPLQLSSLPALQACAQQANSRANAFALM